MGKTGDLKLPASRIKTIMKSSPNVEQISQEALYLMNRCAVRDFIYLISNVDAIVMCIICLFSHPPLFFCVSLLFHEFRLYNKQCRTIH